MSRLYVEGSGTGPPLVLTHGFGDTAGTWDEQVTHLAPRHLVLRWDLIGHGRSEHPQEREAYSREIALDDLDGVIQRAGGPVVLFGHSLGGYLAMCRVIREPEGIRGLVLISTGPGFRDPDSLARWNRGIERAAEVFDVPEAAGGVAEQPDSLVMGSLDRLKLPILLIAGGRDRGYHGALAYLEKKLPRITTLTVPGAGHHCHRTHAGAVNAAIDSFLDSLG